MATNRIVRKLETGERFIETASEHWTAHLEAWKLDHSEPCPMPVGHLMFRHPKAYGAVLEMAPQALDLFARSAGGQEAA
jgi:hypothetical protein